MKRTIVTATLCALAGPLAAQASDPPKATFQVYGHVMTDAGYQVNQNDPAWFDVVRPTKLPSFPGQFDPSGNTYFGVRQSRLGVKTSTPTPAGTVKTQFEFELLGTGADAGQTTFRLRHAYGELGHFGVGQTWSPFMDIDVFPNTLEYWGPNGMVFFRNIQIRYMPVMHEHSRVTIALERPGASGDGGIYRDRIELQDVRPHFPAPDLSAEGRWGGKTGYVELAGILRWMAWEDVNDDTLDLSGDALGWGLNLSSNVKMTRNDVLRLQFVYGHGVENYMNDAPADVGIRNNFGNPRTPVVGVALPVFGAVAFLDHTWGPRFSTSIGYSREDIDNTAQQAPDAFRTGQYAIANVLYYPIRNVMMGVEGQWGKRDNHSDGFSSDDWRIQLGFKYNFSHQWEVSP